MFESVKDTSKFQVDELKDELNVILNRLEIARTQESEIKDVSAQMEKAKLDLSAISEEIAIKKAEAIRLDIQIKESQKNLQNTINEADKAIKIKAEQENSLQNEIEVLMETVGNQNRELVAVRNKIATEGQAGRIVIEELNKEIAIKQAEVRDLAIEISQNKETMNELKAAKQELADLLSELSEERKLKTKLQNERDGLSAEITSLGTGKAVLVKQNSLLEEQMKVKSDECETECAKRIGEIEERDGLLSLKEKSLEAKEKVLQEIKRKLQLIDPSGVSKLKF